MGLVLPGVVEVPNEEIPLSEGAEPYAEQELLSPASEEDLKFDSEDKSPMFTRQKKRVLEGINLETYTQNEADSFDFFEDPLTVDRRPLL